MNLDDIITNTAGEASPAARGLSVGQEVLYTDVKHLSTGEVVGTMAQLAVQIGQMHHSYGQIAESSPRDVDTHLKGIIDGAERVKRLCLRLLANKVA